MTVSTFPDMIDPIVLAEKGVQLNGVLHIEKMDRLRSYFVLSQGEVTVNFELGMDTEGFHYLAGNWQATLNFICQRCLEEYAEVLQADFCLAPIAREEGSDELPSDYEPLLMSNGKVSIAQFIEEEIILHLPLVPKHTTGMCATQHCWESVPEEAEDSKSPLSHRVEMGEG